MGFTRTVGLVRFTSGMRQLSVPTYLRFIARGELSIAFVAREEKRAARFQKHRTGVDDQATRILRILESIHYSARTAGECDVK